MAGRRGAGLAHPGVQAQVAHQVAGRGEPPDVTDGCDQGGRGGGVHPRDGHESADGLALDGRPGDLGVERPDLFVQEVDLAKAGLHGPSFVREELLAGEPGPSGGAEQVGDGWAAHQVAL
jgi:hypothetical protein